jgi:hypothetical protein
LSNWGEFENIVDALREEDKLGNLVDVVKTIKNSAATVK